MAIFEGLRVLA